MSSEFLHLLIERSGITAREFVVLVAVLAYVIVGALVAVGLQITGVRPLRAWAVLASMFVVASAPGLYLFPGYPPQVIITSLFPVGVYVLACHQASRVDRL